MTKLVDIDWLANNRWDTSKVFEKRFFLVNTVALFIPSIAALGLLNRAVVITHTNTLYDMDQLVVNDATIGYLIYIKCPFMRAYENGLLLHARKILDKKKFDTVEIHNALPHFQIVNSPDHNTIVFCRDITSLPKT